MIHELFIVLVLFFFIFRFSEVEKEVSRCFEGFPYIAFTVYLAHAPYDLFDDRFGYKLVSRADGGTEADFVHACKHGNEAPIFFGILESNAADLGHGFTDKGARHDGVAGEMSLKNGSLMVTDFTPTA